MGRWIFLKCGLPGFGPGEVCRWNCPLLGKRVAEERDVPSNRLIFAAHFANALRSCFAKSVSHCYTGTSSLASW